jgi:lysophospholipase L1-like esterase
MKRSALLPFVVLGLTSLQSFAAQTIYTPPPELRSGNPAAIAQARMDWFADVQKKFTKYGGKPADIVFEGDSITNRWEETGREQWKQFFAGRSADFGIEGDRVENALWRLSKGQVDGINPKVVVIMIGTNNSGRDSAEQIAGGIKALVAEYEKRCPRAHIILMGVFPRGEQPTDGGRQKVAAVNNIIKSLNDGKRVSFVDISSQLVQPDGTISKDMMPDFVHPTAKGYEIWAAAIMPIVKKYAP